ncbi:hypothetical protein TSUD_237200 [Trifolium subterraneum]|uniref:RING-type E3 ubiquitin transferase n=1 Tax=Trifolium subterraneum TaxID=3900 RepID=A0A2Z6NX73_TRISU|nr:hypothetical protein TSUD_237200 [Trifolium subterraneum]
MADCFKFKVTAVHRDFTTIHGTSIPTCLFRTSIVINCNEFFTQNQDFLWSKLQGFYLSPYFNYEDLALVSRSLIPRVKEMFGFSDSFRLTIPTTGVRTVDIPLILNIISKVQHNGERIIQEVVEEPSRSQSESMIPASNEVVSSLKAYSLHRNCSICMERFHNDLEEDGASDEVKVSTMACGHIFHYDCIVKWLRTSHVCPLCRYAMPV